VAQPGAANKSTQARSAAGTPRSSAACALSAPLDSRGGRCGGSRGRSDSRDGSAAAAAVAAEVAGASWGAGALSGWDPLVHHTSMQQPDVIPATLATVQHCAVCRAYMRSKGGNGMGEGRVEPGSVGQRQKLLPAVSCEERRWQAGWLAAAACLCKLAWLAAANRLGKKMLEKMQERWGVE